MSDLRGILAAFLRASSAHRGARRARSRVGVKDQPKQLSRISRRNTQDESAPGRIRTCDTGFRRAVLYPLSYGGGRAELTGRPVRRSDARDRSSQLGDHVGEVLDVIVLHGEVCRPILL